MRDPGRPCIQRRWHEEPTRSGFLSRVRTTCRAGRWRKLNRFTGAGGLVDSIRNALILQPLFPGSVRLQVLLNAQREVVHLRSELVFLFELRLVRDLLLEILVVEGVAHLNAVVGEGGVELRPGFRAFHAQELRFVGFVGGVEDGGEAGGELGDDLATSLDFGETRVILGLVDRSLDFVRFFIGEEARGVQAVDADIRHAASAGQRQLLPPLVGIALILGVGGDKLPELAQFAGPDHLDEGAIVGLVLTAVGDHQLDVGRVRGGDHALAVAGWRWPWAFRTRCVCRPWRRAG